MTSQQVLAVGTVATDTGLVGLPWNGFCCQASLFPSPATCRLWSTGLAVKKWTSS